MSAKVEATVPKTTTEMTSKDVSQPGSANNSPSSVSTTSSDSSGNSTNSGGSTTGSSIRKQLKRNQKHRRFAGLIPDDFDSSGGAGVLPGGPATYKESWKYLETR